MKECNDTEGKRSFEPDEAWLDEFEKQATPTLIGRLRRYAKSRARSIARLGGPAADDDYARELVQDALVDSFTGQVHWEPAAKTLEAHVIDVIRYRTRNDLVRALHLPHVSLDTATAKQTGEYFTTEEDALAASLGAATDPELRVLVSETMAAVQRLAGGDHRVLAIVGAIERGATTREDVLALTDLSADEYHKGRIRLTALAQQLPDSLRRAAHGQK
jgi:hypothetical protein